VRSEERKMKIQVKVKVNGRVSVENGNKNDVAKQLQSDYNLTVILSQSGRRANLI
jgi:hypothetical protein